MKRNLIFAVLFFFVYPGLLAAHSIFPDSLSQIDSSADVVDVEIKLSKKLVPSGTNFRAAFLVDIAEGWHINAHRPTLDYLISTELSIQEKEGITVLNTAYPNSQKLNFAFAEEAIAVYEGKVPIYGTFHVEDSLDAGNYTMNGKLRVQACKDQICLSPSSVDFEIPVELAAQDKQAIVANENIFKEYESRTSTRTEVTRRKTDNNEISAMFEEKGAFWAFLGIFLIGLALNLTPCVYPMLSVTVSLFGNEKGKDSIAYSFVMASAYVMGIAFMYSILGLGAAYTGSLFGSWLQSSWITAGIGILIFGLALSMFGLYELQPPRSIQQKLQGMQGTNSAIGHILSGLVVGVFAAPCVGPPVVALLAFVGSQGDLVFGFFSFFILSLGLGLPYLILGTFSSLLSALPGSGDWMVWVKKVFGVVLTGVAAFYLALALTPSYAMNILPPVLMAGGVYLGFIDSTDVGKHSFRYVKWGVGVASVVAGLLIVQNLRKPTLKWEKYTSEKMEAARTAEKPVILDFYADWCIPCHELEQLTYTDPKVIAATSGFKKLKVDLTKYESERSKKLREQFKIASVPTIVFIGEDGREVEEARITGFKEPDAFIDRVHMAQ